MTLPIARISCALGLSLSLSFAPAHAAGKLDAHGLLDGGSYDRFIVRFDASAPERTSVNARQRVLDAAGAGLGLHVSQLRHLAVGADVVKAPRKLDRANALMFMQRLAADPSVAHVEIDAEVHAAMVPADPMFHLQWDMMQPPAGINMIPAWDKLNNGRAYVAIIDSGLTTHFDFSGKVVAGYDFISDTAKSGDGDGRDANASDPGDWTVANQCYAGSPATYSTWHGDWMAGVIGSWSNNSNGIAGVTNWNSMLIPVRVLGKCGGWDSDVIDAIVWSSGGSVPGVPANPNPAEAINLSLAYPGACDPGSAIQLAINTATANGSIVVTAAGNNGADASNYSPASCSNVIDVGATDQNGYRAAYSNYGPHVDVSAPGGDGITVGVWTTYNDGLYAPSNDSYVQVYGTSIAAPHVTGVVAMLQALKAQTPGQIKQILRNTAHPVAGCGSSCGAGIIDADAAIATSVPGISVSDAKVLEGDSGNANAVFSFVLTRVTDVPITIYWSTNDGTAVKGVDYVASGGSTVIPAGQSSTTVSVPVIGNTTAQPDRTFTVNFGVWNGAYYIRTVGTGTIVDDDGTLSLTGSSVAEGNTGTTQAPWTVTLSKPSSLPVTFYFNTGTAGTATAGVDYVAVASTRFTIAAGHTSWTGNVTINGDTAVEPNETIATRIATATGAKIAAPNATLTILNDDGPTLSIGDASVKEGNAGRTAITFPITLSQAAGTDVAFNVHTTDGTATLADADFQGKSVTGLTIPAGTTTSSFTVNVLGDTKVEPNETFHAVLGQATGATILRGTGTGTIVNDD